MGLGWTGSLFGLTFRGIQVQTRAFPSRILPRPQALLPLWVRLHTKRARHVLVQFDYVRLSFRSPSTPTYVLPGTPRTQKSSRIPVFPHPAEFATVQAPHRISVPCVLQPPPHPRRSRPRCYQIKLDVNERASKAAPSSSGQTCPPSSSSSISEFFISTSSPPVVVAHFYDVPARRQAEDMRDPDFIFKFYADADQIRSVTAWDFATDRQRARPVLARTHFDAKTLSTKTAATPPTLPSSPPSAPFNAALRVHTIIHALPRSLHRRRLHRRKLFDTLLRPARIPLMPGSSPLRGQRRPSRSSTSIRRVYGAGFFCAACDWARGVVCAAKESSAVNGTAYSRLLIQLWLSPCVTCDSSCASCSGGGGADAVLGM
ncbi:hypothetical protein B0H16DRAFT_1726218 [Mycena metata]|uniref:Uncharacterized protein n=1 Tax=Mycena metata TaxID=1033252 RepID=A0AAD7IN93_9AGAR|nr:hypothetical protein B0H16DRAFT_1726218 [Mycena metata]